jgi:hypothetical protein
VRLMLKAMRAQRRAKMLAQEFHAVALVGIAAQPHPEQMNMVGHQAIGRAEQSFAGGGVKHRFPESRVEKFIQPAGSSQGHGHCPVNDGVALIRFAGQSREINAPVRSPAGKAIGCGDGGFGLHGKKIERTDVRCYRFSVASNVSSIILKEDFGTDSRPVATRSSQKGNIGADLRRLLRLFVASGVSRIILKDKQ